MLAKIKQYVRENPQLFFLSDKYILIDYSNCGEDEVLINTASLVERLIEKHFEVTYRASYYGIRELQFSH